MAIFMLRSQVSDKIFITMILIGDSKSQIRNEYGKQKDRGVRFA